jgi:hypothetical protein
MQMCCEPGTDPALLKGLVNTMNPPGQMPYRSAGDDGDLPITLEIRSHSDNCFNPTVLAVIQGEAEYRTQRVMFEVEKFPTGELKK